MTGAAGGVGQAAASALTAAGHQVVGFDRIAARDCAQMIQGDILDRAAVIKAAQGCDAVIHLAAMPDESDFLDNLVQPNVVGLYHVCDAARQQGCQRLVLASSVQLVWGHTWDHVITLEEGAQPVNHYALTKLWAENLGEMYARCYNMSVIAARLGWLPRSAEHHQLLIDSPTGRDVFLSHDDAGRFFVAAIAAQMQPQQFEPLFVTSIALHEARVDLSRTRQVTGFQPQDTWPEGIRLE